MRIETAKETRYVLTLDEVEMAIVLAGLGQFLNEDYRETGKSSMFFDILEGIDETSSMRKTRATVENNLDARLEKLYNRSDA